MRDEGKNIFGLFVAKEEEPLRQRALAGGKKKTKAKPRSQGERRF